MPRSHCTAIETQDTCTGSRVTSSGGMFDLLADIFEVSATRRDSSSSLLSVDSSTLMVLMDVSVVVDVILSAQMFLILI